MKFKYQSEIDSLSLSPCLIEFNHVENKPAFRWVFADINDVRNFVPVASKDRLAKRNTVKHWALSFYRTENESVSALKHLYNDKPNLFKVLGTHIAHGVINSEHGICEIKVEDDGHFNHIEYENVDFSVNNFKIVKDLF